MDRHYTLPRKNKDILKQKNKEPRKKDGVERRQCPEPTGRTKRERPSDKKSHRCHVSRKVIIIVVQIQNRNLVIVVVSSVWKVVCMMVMMPIVRPCICLTCNNTPLEVVCIPNETMTPFPPICVPSLLNAITKNPH